MFNQSIKNLSRTKLRTLRENLSLLLFFTVMGLSSQTNIGLVETIKVGGVAEVFFTYGEPSIITKEISGRVVPEVIIDYKEGILNVTTKGEAQGEVVKIYVSGKSLKKIVVDDRAQFHGENKIESAILKITSADHGSIDLMVNSKELHLIMDGGDITLSGMAYNCFKEISQTKTWGTLDVSDLKLVDL